MCDNYGQMMDVQPEGYAIDKEYQDVIYVPEDAAFSLTNQAVTWNKGGEQKINLKPGFTYILPSGYKIEMVYATLLEKI